VSSHLELHDRHCHRHLEASKTREAIVPRRMVLTSFLSMELNLQGVGSRKKRKSGAEATGNPPETVTAWFHPLFSSWYDHMVGRLMASGKACHDGDVVVVIVVVEKAKIVGSNYSVRRNS
jgi:hypothetical protein